MPKIFFKSKVESGDKFAGQESR